MATVTITIAADTYSETTRTDDDEAVALAACLYHLAEVSPSGRVAQIAEAVYRLMSDEPR